VFFQYDFMGRSIVLVSKENKKSEPFSSDATSVAFAKHQRPTVAAERLGGKHIPYTQAPERTF
jgi:hypothetical protein